MATFDHYTFAAIRDAVQGAMLPPRTMIIELEKAQRAALATEGEGLITVQYGGSFSVTGWVTELTKDTLTIEPAHTSQTITIALRSIVALYQQ